MLIELKAQCEHGEFIETFERDFKDEFTIRTAQRYMKLAQNTTRVSHLTLNEALKQLAAEEGRRKSRPCGQALARRVSGSSS